MSWISEMFGPSSTSNPANAAMPYFNQIPGTITPYYQPYIDSGRNALGVLNNQYNSLVNDPNSFMTKFGSQFKASPGYQFEQNQSRDAIDNAAASGGMLGTPYHQFQAGSMSGNIANRDFETYLNHMFNLFGKGLGGYEGMNKMGYDASNNLAESLANNLSNEGQLAYQGQTAENQAAQGRNRNLFELAGGAASYLMDPYRF